MRGLVGKNAIVTGGSSGIGQAIALRLPQEGVNVAINYVGKIEGACETKSAIERGLDSCMASMQASGTKPIVVEADVSSEEQVVRMFGEVMSSYGAIDILINNPGIQITADSDQLSVDDFDRVIAVNLRGSFLCARQAIRHMLEDGRRLRAGDPRLPRPARAAGRRPAVPHRVGRAVGRCRCLPGG